MQKNLKLLFVHYALFIQFHPLNPRLLSKLHQHPPDIPSIKDAIHPSLDLQHTVLRYLSDICPLWDLPTNHAVSVFVAPSFKCAVWMAIVCVGPLPIPSHGLFHLAVSNKARSALRLYNFAAQIIIAAVHGGNLFVKFRHG